MSLCASLMPNLHRKRESAQTRLPPGPLLNSRQSGEALIENWICIESASGAMNCS